MVTEIETVGDMDIKKIAGQESGFWRAWGYHPEYNYLDTGWYLDNWANLLNGLPILNENYKDFKVSISVNEIDNVLEYVGREYDVNTMPVTPEDMNTPGESYTITVHLPSCPDDFYIEFVVPYGWN